WNRPVARRHLRRAGRRSSELCLQFGHAGLRPDVGPGDARPLPRRAARRRARHEDDIRRAEGRSQAIRRDRIPQVDRLNTQAFRKEDNMTEPWLPTLETANPEDGFALAAKLARVGVKLTQPSAELRDKLRASYEQDTAQL